MARRKDAKEVKVTDGFHKIVPYVMPKRTEAEVSLKETFDVTKLMRFIASENKKEGSELKLFHCICYAVAKTVYHRPMMNRFIAGKRFWQRNDITLSFVAKQRFEDGADEVLMFMKTLPEMTVEDVSKFIIGDVKKARENSGNDLDGTMNFVGSLPVFVLRFFFWILKKMEFYGVYPESLAKDDPNYSSVLLSNLGSIGAGAPYHHLSEFGTNSVMITIGTLKKVDNKQYLDMTFTIDERIADGFYFAKSLRYIKYCFENPKFMKEAIKEEFPEGII